MNCVLRHKDVKSALARAKSPECRTVIQKTGCLLEDHKLYFPSVDRLCPVKKWDHGYPRGVTEGVASGPPVRVVFMLTVHGRSLRQVKRLLKSIYHSNHYYYFHVDQVNIQYYMEEDSSTDLLNMSNPPNLPS